MTHSPDMSTQTYRYNRADFAPLPVSLDHMCIFLNFVEERVEGTNVLRLTAREPIEQITLDAKQLELHEVTIGDTVANYTYQQDASKVVVTLPQALKAGETIEIRIRATCIPSDRILEGIYKDTTPDGCPQQYMSQCQQWGFQRILPVLDDCTAKCTMETTLEADARYTHLISNGNVCRTRNPDGRPVPKPGDPSRQVITYVNPVPMAPYLFVATVGTWDMLEDTIVYPSGKHVKLEYVVPRGRLNGARVPMEILKDSVLWQGKTQEYEYRHDVYRTICMEKSNFGGMENVGNTTIVTSAALIDEWTGDRRLHYAYGVIVHEFEHNQCGSDVTMETPFDMWLNEGFTVDVERHYTGSRFDPVCARLDEVDSMRAPIGGPLAIEEAGHLGNIVREGFNDPDELVDGVTYVKAAEVIRMLRCLLGDATFRKAKNRYFDRHTGGNANTDDFFACFEEVSGRDLGAFRKEWLHTIGYPKVSASYQYDASARTLEVVVSQERTGSGGCFHVPFMMAAVGAAGVDMPETVRTVELSESEHRLVIENIDRPAFMSFNRDASFYGTFEDRTSGTDELLEQIRKDPNEFNRVEAMRRLTDQERLRLLDTPGTDISEAWRETYAELVRESSLRPGLKAHLLGISEASLRRDTLPRYRERVVARERLLHSVADHCMGDLVDAHRAVDTTRRGAAPADGLEERMLKGVLLRTLIEANTTEAQAVAEAHFRDAWHITDRIHALSCINRSDHPQRHEIMEATFHEWKDHLNGYTAYLGVVASSPHDDVFERVAAEAQRPEFRIEHPSHNRALFLSLAANNKQLWTDAGIAWMADTVIRMAPINEYTATHLVDSFRFVAQLADDLKTKVLTALQRMDKDVDAGIAPSVSGRVQTFLRGVHGS